MAAVDASQEVPSAQLVVPLLRRVVAGHDTDSDGYSWISGRACAKRAILLPNVRQEVQQLRAEIVELKAEVDKWKDLAQRHVADKAAHVDEIRKLRQEIDQLRAQATAVPDDD